MALGREVHQGNISLKMLFAGSIGISLAGFLWAGDIDIGNEDVQGPAGQVYNNYTFKVDTIGRLLMEPGVHQFGSIWLERDAVCFRSSPKMSQELRWQSSGQIRGRGLTTPNCGSTGTG